MSNKRDLKAYVRYDGNGRIIPGSLILNRFKPAVGNWSETPAHECCNYIPTPETPALRFSSDIAPGGEQGCFSVQTADDGGPDVNGVIDWGDGTIESINIPADTFDNFTHNYLEGSYTATVTFDTPERIIVLYINCNAA
jgi:hypothetical protein